MAILVRNDGLSQLDQETTHAVILVRNEAPPPHGRAAPPHPPARASQAGGEKARGALEAALAEAQAGALELREEQSASGASSPARPAGYRALFNVAPPVQRAL